MKKLIPILMTAAVFAGCTEVSAQGQVNEPTTLSAVSVTTAPSKTAVTGPTKTEKPAKKRTSNASVRLGKQQKGIRTYKNGAPRYDDDKAVKDTKAWTEHRYIMTDDEGDEKRAAGEGLFYAQIPVGENMPERIKFIDIETDKFIGYMYDDGNTDKNGDEQAGDGIYTIKIRFDLDFDTDPNVSKSYSRCFFTQFTDSDGTSHICDLPTFVNVQEPVTEKEHENWEKVQNRIAAVMDSMDYKSADTDKKEEMLLDELEKLAEQGLVYKDLTRTNSSPRTVVYKIVKGPTVIVELEECDCMKDTSYGSATKSDRDLCG
ncbi:MAG: hypothetical protein J6I96_04970 [Oscillospiraceae bacterium]|nr:hypothetical protein [Oscillospiraceae bacterium]